MEQQGLIKRREPEMLACGAKTRAGTPCKNAPMIGGVGNRCKFHGGASLSGELHPRFKHGNCTNLAREKNRQASQKIKLIAQLGNALGMFIEPPRKRK